MDHYSLTWAASPQQMAENASNNLLAAGSVTFADLCHERGSVAEGVATVPMEGSEDSIIVWTLAAETYGDAEAIRDMLTDAVRGADILIRHLETDEELEARDNAHMAEVYADLIEELERVFPDSPPSVMAFSEIMDDSFENMSGTVTLRTPTALVIIGLANGTNDPLLVIPRPDQPTWEALIFAADDLTIHDDHPSAVISEASLPKFIRQLSRNTE